MSKLTRSATHCYAVGAKRRDRMRPWGSRWLDWGRQWGSSTIANSVKGVMLSGV